MSDAKAVVQEAPKSQPKITASPKEKGFAIASVIVKTLKTTHTYKQTTRSIKGVDKKIDELHIKADMTLTCLWHNPGGKWSDSEVTLSRSYNHSRGERVPRLNSPLKFTRIKNGGFEY